MNNRLLIYLVLLLWGVTADAAENLYQVEIKAPVPLNTLLQKHLDIIKWRDNPRMSPNEWQRLIDAAPQQIKALLATEGYFSPEINTKSSQQNGSRLAEFSVTPGKPVLIAAIDIQFTGDITQQPSKETPRIQHLRDSWILKTGSRFRQDEWSQAKRALLTSVLLERYPNASIRNSQATIDPDKQTASLTIEIDSGASVYFGSLKIEGLKRYSTKIIENLNPIKPGSLYNQSQLLTFQTRLQESGYFRSVEVSADTKTIEANGEPVTQAPIKVVVDENHAIKVGLGAGYSTNTGARTQLSVDDLNLFNNGWRLASSLKLEQKAQVLTGEIRLPPTKNGYRDSMNAKIDHTSIEGQATTTSQIGIKRAWGARKREQYVAANLLNEQVNLDGAPSASNYATTLAYGITLRRTNSELAPTKGYLFNAQFTGAPLASLADGTFLQSYIKTQGYYPITNSTQLIARAELGMVNGKNNTPAAYLFRAGGDQSVRGYAYQSLGVTEGDAIVGGRYLATGSVEAVQWLTQQWGAALFFDFGNAANRIQDLDPVYGYGLGARWKSPVGPIGADIAYGQETGEYRMHFNIGVAF